MWILEKIKKIFSTSKSEKHEVIVYDENGSELGKTMEPTYVTHLSRTKHVFGEYTTYSFNTHYDDGMIYYGLVPSPPFNINL